MSYRVQETVMNGQLRDDFRQAFKGRFESVLRWEQLDTFWDVMRCDAAGDWYIYAVGEPPPQQPASAERLRTFLSEIERLLRQEHDEDYCGVVFADSMQVPRFVKIFDPNNLGVSCGFSGNPPLPGWILSKLPPADLDATVPLPGNRRRWWQRWLSA
jgi:hypothetical protein